jgi:hypothetical protein
MLNNRAGVIAIAIALVVCSWSFAATLVDFKPLPSSPVSPEFVFTGPAGSPSFQGGPGAQGNGDGTQAVGFQTPGGLDAEAPFVIVTVPGFSAGVASTEFFDTTLSFTGLVANLPAQNVFGTHIQPLGSGTFTLLSTEFGGPGTGTILLTGTIGNATIVGAGTSGAVFSSATVNYTGGVIYNALISSGANPNNNDMSLSMVDVTPAFNIPQQGGFIGNFTANGTGLFSYNPIPEPTSVALLSLALVGFAVRRRR